MDSSIYGALVWLSQPWNMRYPLISFHGNNGSRDGDSPAAYRYTECKLSPLGEEMLADIKKDTVDWQLAYTDEENEPVYLPGRIPNLLVNGTTGIAVAMACSFAPHNLNEIMDAVIYALNNPNYETKDLLNFVKGPDFPTGGLIVNKDELATAYLTGKGRARIRGEYVIESDKNGKDSIVFTSIPYKVSKSTLITDIDKLCEEGKIQGIASIRDESNRQGVRFVVELSKGFSAEPIIAALFKYSRLEDTYSFNQVALINKTPKLLNLGQMVEAYITHQQDVLVRKCEYEANKIRARIHILEGLLIALADIDNVIKLIKESESAATAKVKLMEKYKLTEIQAKAILDMKLSKLAKLEKLEIEEELKKLQIELNRLLDIITNPIPEMNKIFKEIKTKYGDERRTTITQVATTKEEKEIEFVEPEKCVVIMSEGGLIKRVPASSFRVQKRNGKGVKTQDDIVNATIRTNTIDSLMVFSDLGQMYRLLVNDIPEGTNTAKGQSVKSLVSMSPNENVKLIYSIYRDTTAKYLLFTTKNGLVKKTALDEYTKTKKKSGISAITIKDGDELASVSLVDSEDVILLTKNGMAIRFSSTEIAPTSRATSGIKGINLAENDYVVSCIPVRDIKDDLAVFASGLSKRIKLTDLPKQKRAGKGLICYKGTIVDGAMVNDEDQLLIIGNHNSICISAKDIPVLGRASAGNQIIKNDNIVSVSKV